jgi:hypothetical protein
LVVQSYRLGAAQHILSQRHLLGNSSRCKLWAVTTRTDPIRCAITTEAHPAASCGLSQHVLTRFGSITMEASKSATSLVHSMVSQMVIFIEVFRKKICS